MQQIKEFLDEKYNQFNQLDFIELDPISIPHRFNKKEDIEIAGFFAATLAWGNRKAIIKSLNQLISWMDHSPYDFIINSTDQDQKIFQNFKYRTFNGIDCTYFIKAIKNIYLINGGLENLFADLFVNTKSIKQTISEFKHIFFSDKHESRTMKHVADPLKGSAAKRINMYLRWMVRQDNKGVDFGIWKNIPKNELMIPLDVHTGTVARKLGLLDRKQNDWQAVEILTNKLKEFDSNDPIKYDFALFGLGVNGEL